MDDYGVAVLDLSDPAKPLYAEHRADHKQNVGSVGKLVVALALFQALADLYPDDVEARRRVLKNTVVTADTFSQRDSHTVRMFDVESRKLTRRAASRSATVRRCMSFWTGCCRPAPTGAAGMVMREAMLLRKFGKAYPVPEAEIQRFFNDTPKSRAHGAVRRHLQRTHHAQRAGHRQPAPGQLLHRRRQGPRAGYRR